MPRQGKIGYHKLPRNRPPQLVPLIINQDDYFPAGILQKDLNNFGPRVGLVYNAQRPYGRCGPDSASTTTT